MMGPHLEYVVLNARLKEDTVKLEEEKRWPLKLLKNTFFMMCDYNIWGFLRWMKR